MFKQFLEKIARHAITFLGGALAARGYTLELDGELTAGLASAVAGLILSIVEGLKSAAPRARKINYTDLNQ